MDAAYRVSRTCAKHNRKDNARCFLLASVVIIFSLVLFEAEPTRGHFQSHDNILRIQLWDSDALSRSARLSDDKPSGTTDKIVESSKVVNDRTRVKKVHVKVDDLMGEMLNTYYESQLTSRDVNSRRYRRHRKHKRNKRRRKIRNNTISTHFLPSKRKRNLDEHSSIEKSASTKPISLTWRFHDKNESINVLTYESNNDIEASDGHPRATANNESKQSSTQNKTERSLIVNANSVPPGEVGAPPWGNSLNTSNSGKNGVDLDINNSSSYKVLLDKTNDSIGKVNQQFDIALGEDKSATGVQDIQTSKHVAVVRKCCDIGQNITAHATNGTRGCAPTILTFQPLFYEMYNSSHLTTHTSNLFETIVGNPCQNKRYKLDPEANSIDEFYLLTNGSIFAPFRTPQSLGPHDFCMETFWNGTNDAGLTLPLVCFDADETEEAASSTTLVIYAIGLLISVPFLLATTLVYALMPELREAHGLALASHCGCLAVAFTCLAATQLAGHAFPENICTGIAYMIQFSFVACFFWLNVMCYNTWLNVRHYLSGANSRGRERRRFALYSLYAWLLPLVLLLVSLVMDFSPAVPSTYVKPDFGIVGCWFKSDQGALPYFYAPIGCILFANFIIFILTSRAFAKQLPRLDRVSIAELTDPELVAANADDSLQLSDPTSPSDATSPSNDSSVTNKFNNFKHRWEKYKKIFRTCCLLSIVMGLSWMMEVVSWAVGGSGGVWSVFDVINALQGLVVFTLFVAVDPVRGIVWKRFIKRCCCLRSTPSTAVCESEIPISQRRQNERVYV